MTIHAVLLGLEDETIAEKEMSGPTPVIYMPVMDRIHPDSWQDDRPMPLSTIRVVEFIIDKYETECYQLIDPRTFIYRRKS